MQLPACGRVPFQYRRQIALANWWGSEVAGVAKGLDPQHRPYLSTPMMTPHCACQANANTGWPSCDLSHGPLQSIDTLACAACTPGMEQNLQAASRLCKIIFPHVIVHIQKDSCATISFIIQVKRPQNSLGD